MKTRGWCQAHYMRWFTRRDVEAERPIGPYFSGAPVDRFEAHVDRNGPVPAGRPDLGPCWIWNSYKKQGGYGKMRVDGREVLVHRWAYEYFVGPIPEGLEPDHLCRNPPCVNPSHLEPVSHRENMLRSDTPAARCARRTACDKGHKFTPENTFYTTRDNARHCKKCNREKCREAHLKRKARKAARGLHPN